MCAIAGIIDYRKKLTQIGEQIYSDMLKTMHRRGPDQNGKYITDNAVLLHARLSVIDIENGKQPMSYENYTIVYNGELYNTSELREKLQSLGVTLKTKSDTEVLLQSYITWGEDCVNQLNGIFAFAVWDEYNQKLFIARDKIGVKPFFFSIVDSSFVFASEIKTLLKSKLVKPEIDINSISEIMLIGPGRTSGNGIFKNVFELKPAECGYFSANGLDVHSYWDFHDKPFNEPFEDVVENVKFLLNDSITRQLLSDVPIGTFLSGGLDSSIISSIASQYMGERGEDLNCFSVYYKDNDKFFKSNKFQPNSDTEYIEIMKKYLAKNCNVKHHHIEIETEELADALYSAVDARDLVGMADVDSSLLLFCKEVKNHCTVALSGECADEIFGGYPWYRDKSIRESEEFPWAKSTSWRASFLKDDIANKINPSEYVFNKYQQTAQNSDLSHTLDYSDKMGKIMINLNMKWFMQTLLDRKDRMSMYSGLEVRVPFCDYRIAEYMYSVPWEYKDYQNYEKGLLRKATEDILPVEIAWRKKSPYPKTHNPAYLKLVSQRLNDIILNPNEPIFDIIKKESLISLLDSKNQTPWYGQLMTIPQTIAYFLQLNYWLKSYNIRIV